MPASTFMPEVEVSIAFDSGYLTPAASRTWTDVTTYVEAKDLAKISRGRADNEGAVAPSSLSLTLDNRDGRFTPEYAAGAYYPNVKKGRPIRVRARWVIGGGGTWFDLVTGYVDEWPVEWPDGTASVAVSQITAMSRMARMGRGSAFKSIVEEEILADAPVAYWTLGDAEGSTVAGETSGNSQMPPLQIAGTGADVVFGSATGPGTDDLTAVDLAGGKYFALSGLSIGAGTLGAFVRVPSAPAAQATVLELLGGALGLTVTFGLYVRTDGKLEAFFNGTLVGATNIADGETHHVAVRLGASSGVAIYLDGVSDASNSNVTFAATYSSLVVGVGLTGTISHVSVNTVGLAPARIAAHAAAGLTGFAGEASGARIARYARLAGIPTAEVDVTETGLSTSIAHIDTTGRMPVEVMQDVATTEDGLVFDGRDGVLTFHSRSHRYGATSAFTLDCSLQEVEADLSPVLDDQGMVNEMTASRANGATIRSVNQASIDDGGFYRETIELVTTSDNEVQARADWAVNRFGTPRVKLSSITVSVIAESSAQITALLTADLGTRFTVSNLHAQAPASSMQFFIEGISYEIGPEFFTVSFNTSAAAYGDVWILDSSTFSVLDSTTVLAY